MGKIGNARYEIVLRAIDVLGKSRPAKIQVDLNQAGGRFFPHSHVINPSAVASLTAERLFQDAKLEHGVWQDVDPGVWHAIEQRAIRRLGYDLQVEGCRRTLTHQNKL